MQTWNWAKKTSGVCLSVHLYTLVTLIWIYLEQTETHLLTPIAEPWESCIVCFHLSVCLLCAIQPCYVRFLLLQHNAARGSKSINWNLCPTRVYLLTLESISLSLTSNSFNRTRTGLYKPFVNQVNSYGFKSFLEFY